jgi:hypothetical protein
MIKLIKKITFQDAVEYLYYRIYLNIKKVKTNNLPAFTAYLFLVFFQTMNALCLFSGIANFLIFSISRNEVYIICLLVSGLLFYVNGKYILSKHKQICEKYEKESPDKKIIGTFLIIGYLILSISFVVVISKL